MQVRIGFLRAFLAAAMTAGGTLVMGATAASGCSGGVAFDWAVAHAHGGILRGTVVSATVRDDYTADLVLSNVSVVRGSPSARKQLHVAGGAVCDQSADPGEIVVVLFDLRGGDYPFPLPLSYVVEGRDALLGSEVADALPELPETDRASDQGASRPPGTHDLPWIALSGGLAWLIALRRFGRTVVRRVPA